MSMHLIQWSILMTEVKESWKAVSPTHFLKSDWILVSLFVLLTVTFWLDQEFYSTSSCQVIDLLIHQGWHYLILTFQPWQSTKLFIQPCGPDHIETPVPVWSLKVINIEPSQYRFLSTFTPILWHTLKLILCIMFFGRLYFQQ